MRYINEPGVDAGGTFKELIERTYERLDFFSGKRRLQSSLRAFPAILEQGEHSAEPSRRVCARFQDALQVFGQARCEGAVGKLEPLN